MSTLNKNLLDEVLSLPSDLRTQLIDKLIESLNAPLQKDIDKLWAKEVEKRLDDVNSGNVKIIPGERVFREIRNRFQQ